MCLVECIASAASGIVKQNHETQLSSQLDRANLLDSLRFILDQSKQHFNRKYRHRGINLYCRSL